MSDISQEKDEKGRRKMKKPGQVFLKCELCGAAFFPEVNVIINPGNCLHNNKYCQECIRKIEG